MPAAASPAPGQQGRLHAQQGRPRIRGRRAEPGWGCSPPVPLAPCFKVPAPHRGDPGIPAQRPCCRQPLMSIYVGPRSRRAELHVSPWRRGAEEHLGLPAPMATPWGGMQALLDPARVPFTPSGSSCSPRRPWGGRARQQSPAYPTVPRPTRQGHPAPQRGHAQPTPTPRRDHAHPVFFRRRGNNCLHTSTTLARSPAPSPRGGVRSPG